MKSRNSKGNIKADLYCNLRSKKLEDRILWHSETVHTAACIAHSNSARRHVSKSSVACSPARRVRTAHAITSTVPYRTWYRYLVLLRSPTRYGSHFTPNSERGQSPSFTVKFSTNHNRSLPRVSEIQDEKYRRLSRHFPRWTSTKSRKCMKLPPNEHGKMVSIWQQYATVSLLPSFIFVDEKTGVNF